MSEPNVPPGPETPDAPFAGMTILDGAGSTPVVPPSLSNMSGVASPTGVVSPTGAPAPSPAPPPTPARRYELVRTLGVQGIGTVSIVHDVDLKRQLLLKEIDTTSPLLPRFLEETQIMGQLEHPNIGTVHEFGHIEGKLLFYTMPYVPGRSLASVIERLRSGDPEACRSWTLPVLMRIFQQVVQAACHAHSHGVIHRDLHPGNVWLGDHGQVLVMNWGMAKVIKKGAVETGRVGSLTRFNELVGTPEYNSPELAVGQEAAPSSDLYSLGVMLYELLTLTVPFQGETVEILTAHVLNLPEPPTARAGTRPVPVELERACLKALSKSPSDRHADAGQLHDEVQAWVESESNRSRKRADVNDLIQQCRDLFSDYRRRRAERGATKRSAAAPTTEQSPVPGLPGPADLADPDLALAAHDVVRAAARAFREDPENPDAARLLYDVYMGRFKDADAHGEHFLRDFFGMAAARFSAPKGKHGDS